MATPLRDLSRALATYKELCLELRVQLSAKTRECDEAIRRGDLLMDKLLAYAGQHGMTQAGRIAQAREQQVTQQFLKNIDEDQFAEIPLAHPESRFTDPTQALIDPAAREPEEE